MIHTPYTPFFSDAFLAAHGAIGILLVALVWASLRRTSLPAVLLVVAIALSTVAPAFGDFVHSMGATSLPPAIQADALLASGCLVVVATLALGRPLLAIAAAGVTWVVATLGTWVPKSPLEICALQTIWIGIVIGLIRRRLEPPAPSPPLGNPTSARRDDIWIFVLSTLAAALVSIYVLQRADGSADEWAYTWQAAVFAKGHLYASTPPCETAFQSFYVFDSLDRMFSQYTPGWPLFMAPFALFRLPWLAGPFAHGFMAVGVAHAARSVARLDGRGSSARVAAAGRIAAAVMALGTTMLLLGGSRFSHSFEAGLFAWTLEALLVLREEKLDRDRQLRWAIVLGAAVAFMGATRPADGALLSVGLFFYALHGFFTRRYGVRVVLAALGSCLFVAFVVLVILRVQIGRWFVTGYALNEIIHPWNVVKYDLPKPEEIRYALPLDTGSYCWFPCSVAVGLAGLLSLRRGATGVAAALLVSVVAFETYYQFLDLNRVHDWGYGPRYMMPIMVPMAIGTGIALAPLSEAATRRAGSGPYAVVVVTMAATLIRLWPLLYPGIYAHVKRHDSLNAAIRDAGIHHAVVLARVGTTGFDSRDLTENLPIDLYPDQDVLIGVENTPTAARCIRASFPDRAVYSATGVTPVIQPY